MPLNCGVEKTPESPLDSKEIKPVNLKRDQPWIVTARTDIATETLVLWSSDVNRWLEKSLILGKVEGRRRRWPQRMRWLDGITDAMNMNLANSSRGWGGQGGLCSVIHGVAESDTTGDWTTTTAIYFTWTNIWRNYFNICTHNLLYCALQILCCFFF